MRSAGYIVDPEDPRAPPQAEWDAMTPEERAHVVASLPSKQDLLERARQAAKSRADRETRRADDLARRADEAARRAERLAARLRALGVDPDDEAR